MADRRRRRKPVNGGDSDESSDESVNGVINHTLSDLGSDAEAANSEYESADEEDILPPGAEADQANIDAKLDDDEDRKNPQYIPKKGTFYEHDDRTMPPDEENNMMRSEVVTEERFPGADLPVVEISNKAKDSDGAEQDGSTRPIKKKVWRGDEERWCHDKFEEVEQLPKPREELVSVYGYDIRSEEGAPRARRRRRYGRGPNKYTRNWEDLDAYTRPARGAPVGGPRGGGRGRGRPPHPDHLDEDFPALPGQDGDERVGTGNGSIKNQDITEEINSNITSGDVSHSVSSGGAGDNTVKPENRNRGGGKGRDSGGPGRKQSSNSGSSYSGVGPEPITVQHSTHTYTNQEYRRNKPQQQEFVDEERGTGGRGRGRGGRGGAPRGGGRGRPDKPGGWKQPYGGGGPNTAYDSTNRGSDDVRMLSGGGRGGPPPQQQYQQPAAPPNKRGGGGPHSPRVAPSTYQPELPPHHDAKHGGRGTPQQPPSSGGHQYPQQPPPTLHSPHHQPPNYSQQPPPQHSSDQQQHPQQQFPRQKRYSSQRPGRGGGGQDMGGGSGANPHYTPHPHHNLYYQDTSTTPPPDSLPSSGPAMNNSAVDAVVYSGGTVIYNDGGGLPVTSTNVRHLPPPHSVSLPPPPSSQFVATAGPPPQGQFVAQSGFIPRGPVAAVNRLFTPNSQAALLTSGPVSVVGPTAPAGMVGPVLGVPPPIMTGSPMPGVGGPVPVVAVARPPFLPPTDSLLNPGFAGAPPPTAPQQFQGPPPHPPQFPPFQPYATAPVPTEPAQQPQEVYRNGVMYYNTQSQQPQRSSVTLQKRPKAAIPIVPPPDRADGAAEDGGAVASLSSEPGQEDRADLRDEESNHGEVYADAIEEQMPSEARSLRSEAFGGSEVAGDGEEKQLPSRGKVDAVVDPSEHYALQQLQLQQSEHSKRVSLSSLETGKGDELVASVHVDEPATALVEVKPASTEVEVNSLTATVKADPVIAAAKEVPVIPAASEVPVFIPAAKVEPVAAAVEMPASVCLPVVKTVTESSKEEEDRPSAPDHPKQTATEAINSIDEGVDRPGLESDNINEVAAVEDFAEHVKDRKPVENMLVQAAEQENVPSRESINGTTGKEV